jgi:uncharacterized membrane protein YsdA (DUF1294 family)/cold shock CspA family protein
MRLQGKITHWKDAESFGFITPNNGGERVFVHIRSFTGKRRPSGNELVTYELTKDAQGRTNAARVAFIGQRLPKTNSPATSPAPFLFVAAFLGAVAFAVTGGKLPPIILGLYVGASLITFIAYAWDKSAAMNDRWRTQESTLHLFSLVGGWPGALLAQRLIRHKSKKRPFLTMFWITVTLNCGGLCWLCTQPGGEILHTLLGNQEASVSWK